MSLPKEIEQALQTLPSTTIRLTAALHFSLGIAHKMDDESAAYRRREAYMRAALAEFVSVEDVLEWEHPNDPYRIWLSSNPLLHIMRELRNLNIHLPTSQLSTRTISVRWGDNGDPFDMPIYVIEDLTADKFSQLKNARFYTPEQITQLIDWFNAFHAEWGIMDAIHQAVCYLATALIERYKLAENP